MNRISKARQATSNWIRKKNSVFEWEKMKYGITVPLRRNLTGNAHANEYRADTERIQECERNGYRMDTEQISNGYRMDTEQ